jgi:hypothetical protein
MTKIKVNNAVSIKHSDNTDLLQRAMNRGIVAVDNATNLTTPNINVPYGALTYFRPKAIEILTAPRVADRIATPQKNGMWGDRAITFYVKEYSGKPSPDDGTANNATEVKTNLTNFTRGVYYYTSHWYSNDLLETRAGAYKDDYRASQVEAALRTLAIERNRIFFKGVQNVGTQAPIYGLLNDPALLPYNTVPAVGDETYWSDKEPEDIKNDIVQAVQKLITQSNGIVSDELQNGRLILAVANGSVGQLAKANTHGLTAGNLLKEEYGDRLDIVSVPQFNSADSSSDVFYLIFTSNDVNNETILNSFVEQSRTYPIFVKDSEMSQKISAASSGCIVQYPIFITRWNGIGQTAQN